ncbi:inner membrane protein YiaA [uncultured Stenotrophomonas sp.]|uniref:inner membrane protein YiaA n=1 Tax=uncultured Stenotrophomonas sp. TaxID=165438 RepID=UPI0025E5F317|nr:inner membrane protein YiaA [uncultured Stenotrophomonas sp.]
MNTAIPHKPSTAFIAASWVALLLGAAAYLIGLFNAATMALNEKGYYLTLLLFGLFAAVSLQKSVRDRVEGIAVSGLYYALCWFALLSALMLLLVGLWNATLASSEKGFYGMAYALSLFGAVAVQKNTRDLIAAGGGDGRRSAVVPPLPEQD